MTPSKISRRNLLRLMAAALAAPALFARTSVASVRRATAQLAENKTLFPLGVQAGGARATSATLWTFVEDGGPARLSVWRRGQPSEPVVEEVLTNVDGFVHAPVEGLLPETDYEYAFIRDGGPGARGRSTVGRLRTAFAEHTTKPLVLGATACTHFDHMPYSTLEHVARRDLDAFCQLGDMSYNDGANTLSEFRAMWRRTLTDPGYRAVLSSTSLYATWDDHEVRNDWVPSKLPGDVLTAGTRALREALAIPELPEQRLWTSYRWGRTAEIFVLDCRGERTEGACGRPLGLRVAGIVPGCEEPRIMSTGQLAWLQRGLTASPCHFKVVLTSVPISACTGWPNWSDRWQGHAGQRNALLDHIVGTGIRNVWFLTGDFHFPALARVEREGPRRRLREILVGPGANTSGWMDHMRREEPERLPEVLPKDQFEWTGAVQVGTVLTFDPREDSVRVVYLGRAGETVLDRTLREDPLT